MVQEPDMSSDKFFEYDHIIEKFFKDHHDKDGLAELKNWQNHIKKCFFNYEARRLVYQKFLQRRKQILDAQFEWTPANKERFVTLNRQIYETERGLYNNLKVMKKNFKKIERSRQWRSFLPINYTISGIRYMGSYIEGEDDENSKNLQKIGDMSSKNRKKSALLSRRSKRCPCTSMPVS